MVKHLYIIGNGFDLHHGINSSYKDFQEWMYENNPDVIEKADEIYGICDDEWWSDCIFRSIPVHIPVAYKA